MIQGQTLPTLDSILTSGDEGIDLALKYHKFSEEFKTIYPDGYVTVSWGESSKEATKLKLITRSNLKQMRLESAIYNFARFAGYALTFK